MSHTEQELSKESPLLLRLDRALESEEYTKKRDRIATALCFGIPFLAMFVIYIFDLIYPFSWNSVLVLDLNGQYVGFYEALRSFVYGDGSMLYSFARSLGGEMMGIYAYYLASPLSYIVALFPEGNMTEALLFIFILKAGLCGLTFGLYMRHTKALAPHVNVAFSTLYALQSFAIVMQHNNMWMDALILLPLITWGIESVIKYRRFRMFVLSLAMALLSNFYIGYMVCIYVFIYYIYYSVAFSRDGRNNPLGEKQHTLRSFLRMGVYSILAIGMAAIILLTVVYSLSLGKSDFTTPSYAPTLRFDFFTFLSKLMPAVYDTVEPEGFPFIFCGTLTVILLPLYLLNRRFRRRERVSSFLLLLAFYFSMCINTVDILWHGGQTPNWLNYRYSFMFSFLILVMASRAFARLSDYSVREIVTVSGVLILFVGAAAALQIPHFSPILAIIAALAICIYTLMLYGHKRYERPFRSFLSFGLCALILVETIANGVVNIYALHENVGALPRQSYVDYHEKTQPAVDYIENLDDGFYRIETENHRTTNDPMELNYNALTNSTSTLNAKTLRFLHRIGMLAESNYSKYKGRTVVLDSLLGVKYLIGEASSDYFPDGYQKINTVGTKTVFQNPYALPIAYAVNSGIKDCDISDLLPGPLNNQNKIVSAMLGKDTKLYTPITSFETRLENINRYIIDVDGTSYYEYLSDVYEENRKAINDGTVSKDDLSAADSTIVFKFTAPQRGRLYFYMPTDYRNELSVTVNNRKIGSMYGIEGDRVMYLGGFSAGQTVTVTLRMEECLYCYYPVHSTLFYFENLDTVHTACTELSENPITLTEHGDTYFKGSITTTEERPTVFTTIPYDEGWQVTVDGKPVKTYEALEALLAFDLAPGEHTVEMLYEPDCYIQGRAISLISLALFALIVLLEELLRRGILRPKENGFLTKFLNLFFFMGEIPVPINVFAEENMLPRKKKSLPPDNTDEKEEASDQSEPLPDTACENGDATDKKREDSTDGQ